MNQNPYQNWLYYLKRGTSELWSMVLFGVAVVVLLILLGYHADDAGWSVSGNDTNTKHFLGRLGAYSADGLLSLLGYAAYWIPLGLVHIAWQIVRTPQGLAIEMVLWRLLGLVGSTLLLACIFALHWETPINGIAQTGGGFLGQVIGIALLHVGLVHHVLFIYLLLFGLFATMLFDIRWGQLMYGLGKVLAERLFNALKPDASEEERIRFSVPSNQQAEIRLTHSIEQLHHEFEALEEAKKRVRETPQPTPSPAESPTQSALAFENTPTSFDDNIDADIGFFAPKDFVTTVEHLPHYEPTAQDYLPPMPDLLAPAEPAPRPQSAFSVPPEKESALPKVAASPSPSLETTQALTESLTLPEAPTSFEPIPITAAPVEHVQVAPVQTMSVPDEPTVITTPEPQSALTTEPLWIGAEQTMVTEVTVETEQREPIIDIPAHSQPIRLKIKPFVRPSEPSSAMSFNPIPVEPIVPKPAPQSALPKSAPEAPKVEPVVVPVVSAPKVEPAPVESVSVTPEPQSALPEHEPLLLPEKELDKLADPQFWAELAHVLEPEPVQVTPVVSAPTQVDSVPIAPVVAPITPTIETTAPQSALVEPVQIEPVRAAPVQVTPVAVNPAPEADAAPASPVETPAPESALLEPEMLEPEPVMAAVTPAPIAPAKPVPQSALPKVAPAQVAPVAKVYPDEYLLPSMHLFKLDTSLSAGYSDEELDEMANTLENALRSYRIQASVANIEQGPVVTSFEIDPAAGTKGSQISNLDRDLARSLSVPSLRVVEVLPGKPYIGLEIPNRHRSMVHFRTILESPAYQAQTSPLTMVLGCNISGEPVVTNLGAMPHLLVAGTTGSGKSVGINVMLASMLCKAKPDELKLILIDPKMLEMSMYEGIPHLITPVVTDMNDAENALKWAVAEMERRYQLMSGLKVRKIDEFNQIIKDANARGEVVYDPNWDSANFIGIAQQPPVLKPLPYLVIVIDELADMMMVVGKKVEDLIARIAQKARAAGIHLILATQRPSVDVLTGLIKANVPSRIAFQVSSKIDSRTILDAQGAESLLGHGDMLFAPSGKPSTRVHGAFISDSEVDALTKYLRTQGEPEYEEAITQPVAPASMGAFGAAEMDSEQDELFDQAVHEVLASGKTSISYVQRKLSIGYNRAAKLIETMERVGILSRANDRGVRQILVERNPFDE